MLEPLTSTDSRGLAKSLTARAVRSIMGSSWEVDARAEKLNGKADATLLDPFNSDANVKIPKQPVDENDALSDAKRVPSANDKDSGCLGRLSAMASIRRQRHNSYFNVLTKSDQILSKILILILLLSFMGLVMADSNGKIASIGLEDAANCHTEGDHVQLVQSKLGAASGPSWVGKFIVAGRTQSSKVVQGVAGPCYDRWVPFVMQYTYAAAYGSVPVLANKYFFTETMQASGYTTAVYFEKVLMAKYQEPMDVDRTTVEAITVSVSLTEVVPTVTTKGYVHIIMRYEDLTIWKSFYFNHAICGNVIPSQHQTYGFWNPSASAAFVVASTNNAYQGQAGACDAGAVYEHNDLLMDLGTSSTSAVYALKMGDSRNREIVTPRGVTAFYESPRWFMSAVQTNNFGIATSSIHQQFIIEEKIQGKIMSGRSNHQIQDSLGFFYIATRFLQQWLGGPGQMTVYALAEPFQRDAFTPVRYTGGNTGRAVFWTFRFAEYITDPGCKVFQMFVMDLTSWQDGPLDGTGFFGKLMELQFSDTEIRAWYVITKDATPATLGLIGSPNNFIVEVPIEINPECINSTHYRIWDDPFIYSQPVTKVSKDKLTTPWTPGVDNIKTTQKVLRAWGLSCWGGGTNPCNVTSISSTPAIGEGNMIYIASTTSTAQQAVTTFKPEGYLQPLNGASMVIYPNGGQTQINIMSTTKHEVNGHLQPYASLWNGANIFISHLFAQVINSIDGVTPVHNDFTLTSTMIDQMSEALNINVEDPLFDYNSIVYHGQPYQQAIQWLNTTGGDETIVNNYFDIDTTLLSLNWLNLKGGNTRQIFKFEMLHNGVYYPGVFSSTDKQIKFFVAWTQAQIFDFSYQTFILHGSDSFGTTRNVLAYYAVNGGIWSSNLKNVIFPPDNNIPNRLFRNLANEIFFIANEFFTPLWTLPDIDLVGCTPDDEFAPAMMIFVDSEVSDLPFYLNQSEIVTFGINDDTTQKVTAYQLEADGSFYKNITWDPFLGFAIENIGTELTRQRLNESVKIGVHLRNCHFAWDTFFLTNEDFRTTYITPLDNEVRYKEILLNLRFTDCAAETFTAVTPLRTFYVQKNDITATTVDGMPNSVVLIQEADIITELFNLPLSPACPIVQWYMALVGTEDKIPNDNNIAKYFNQVNRVNPIQSLHFDVAFPLFGSELNEFDIRVFLKFTTTESLVPILHSQAAGIQVFLGCYDVGAINVIGNPEHPNFKSFDDTLNTYTLVRPADPNPQFFGFQLNEILYITTNDYWCGVHKISSYTEETATIPTDATGPVHMQESPWTEDETGIQINPTINYVVNPNEAPANFTLKLESDPSVPLQQVTRLFTVAYTLCDDIPEPGLEQLVPLDQAFNTGTREVDILLDVYPLGKDLRPPACAALGYDYLLSSDPLTIVALTDPFAFLTETTLALDTSTAIFPGPLNRFIQDFTFYIIKRDLASMNFASTPFTWQVFSCAVSTMVSLDSDRDFFFFELGSLQAVTNMSLWFDFNSNVDQCNMTYYLETSSDGGFTFTIFNDTNFIYSMGEEVLIDVITPFVRSEYYMVIQNNLTQVARQKIWVESCGMETVNLTNFGEPIIDTIDKGFMDGLAPIPAESLETLFILTTPSLSSKCLFNQSELIDMTAAPFVSTDIFLDETTYNANGMQTLYVNTAVGFYEVTFYLKYSVLGGRLPNQYALQEIRLEVCGTEIIDCNPTEDNRILLQEPGSSLVIDADFTASNFIVYNNVNCNITSYTLYEDVANTVEWPDSRVAFDIFSSSLQPMYPIIISKDAPDDYRIYVQGKTRGMNTCTFVYHIEICEILAPIQGQDVYIELVFNLYEGVDSYMYLPFKEFFSGSSNETATCFFQNHAMEEFNDNSFYYYYYYYYYEYYDFSGDFQPYSGYELYYQLEGGELRIDTIYPLHSLLRPKIAYARMDDRFGNTVRQGISILVCGGESVFVGTEPKRYAFGWKQLNDEGEMMQVIPDFKSWFETNIPECPVETYEVFDFVTEEPYIFDDILIDAEMDMIYVSTAANVHRELAIVGFTNASVANYQSVFIDICGEEEVLAFDPGPLKAVLDLTFEVVDLFQLAEASFYDLFASSDPLCDLVDFYLTSYDEVADDFIPFNNDFIFLDKENEPTILVSTQVPMDVTLYLNAVTGGQAFNYIELNIFICGGEKVTFNGQASMDLSYEEDSDLFISADVFLDGFESSSPEQCPVYFYSLSYDEGGEVSDPVIQLDGNAISLMSEDLPDVDFDFPVLFNEFEEKLTTFYVLGCTYARVCAEFKVNLKKLTCDESVLTAGAADLSKEITIENSETIGASDYEELFSPSLPKCPAEWFGLAWDSSADDLETNLDGIISMSESGEITFDNEGLIALESPSVTFYILAEDSSYNQASVSVTLTITPPEPEEEEVEEEVEENATESDEGGEAAAETIETAAEETTESESDAGLADAIASIVEEPLPVTEPAPDPKPAAGKNPVKKKPGTFNFSPLWVAPPRPKPVVQSTDDADAYVPPPPEPASLRAITLGSKGDVGMKFSDDIEIPSGWKTKFQYDNLRTSASSSDRQLARNLRARGLAGRSFLSVKLEGATNGVVEDLDPDIIIITNIDSKGIDYKINFESPALLSMADQSINDRLLIGFTAPIYGKNGLLLDTGNLAANEKGIPEPKFDIQPMVDEKAAEQEALDSAAESIFNVGLLLMLVQFLITYLASTSLSFFWELINSQVNYCYLPLISVNPPGQVSFYLDILIFIVTFDPIPVDIVYEIIPIWNFNYVNEANDREVFSRIGIEDRNVLNVLGSMFLFVAIFAFSQIIYNILLPFKSLSYRVRQILRIMHIESAYRTILIIFFCEAYLDLALGGIISTENHIYLYDSTYWGSRGRLSGSDQFAIIFGIFIYGGTMILPFIVIILMDKQYALRFQSKHNRHHFNFFYEFLYDGIRTNMPGILQYFSVFLLRKLIYAMIVYHFAAEVYVMFQVFSNIILSFLFTLYLAKFKPFIDRDTMQTNLFNEFCYYLTSVIYLTFTDFNPDAYAKVLMGWILIVIVIGNLCFPNGYHMVKGIWPDIKMLIVKEPRQRRQWVKQLDEKRATLINNHSKNFKLREEFKEVEKFDWDKPLPKKNQTIPLCYYPNINNEQIYMHRSLKYQKKKQVKSLYPVQEEEDVEEQSSKHISIIQEQNADEELDSMDKMDEMMMQHISQVMRPK